MLQSSPMTTPPAGWKPWVLILLMGLGGGGIVVLWSLLRVHHWGPIRDSLPQTERAALDFILWLDLTALLLAGLAYIGIPTAQRLGMAKDVDDLKRKKSWVSALLGIPTGGLLLWFGSGDLVLTRLPWSDLGVMMGLGCLLLVGGFRDWTRLGAPRSP